MPDEQEPLGTSGETQGRIWSWLFDRGCPTYAGLVVLISLVKYGVDLYPSWNYMKALAENWRDPLLDPILRGPAGYRLSSSTSAVVAGLLGILSGSTFLGFHFVLVCSAITAPFFTQKVRRSPELRMTVALLLVGGSVPPVLLGWIGSYDPVTIGAGAVAALTESRRVAFFAWVLFAFNHAPEAALALLIFAVVLSVHERRAAQQQLVVAAAGWLAGYLAIRLLVASWGGAVGRGDLSDFYGSERYFNSALHFFPLIVLSALGIGWLFLLSREVYVLPAAKALIGLAVALSIASFMPLALDISRVVTAVLWPSMLLVAALSVQRLPRGAVNDLLLRLTPAALVLPVLIVWDNRIAYGGWQGLWNFVGYVFGGQPIPVSP